MNQKSFTNLSELFELLTTLDPFLLLVLISVLSIGGLIFAIFALLKVVLTSRE